MAIDRQAFYEMQRVRKTLIKGANEEIAERVAKVIKLLKEIKDIAELAQIEVSMYAITDVVDDVRAATDWSSSSHNC